MLNPFGPVTPVYGHKFIHWYKHFLSLSLSLSFLIGSKHFLVLFKWWTFMVPSANISNKHIQWVITVCLYTTQTIFTRDMTQKSKTENCKCIKCITKSLYNGLALSKHQTCRNHTYFCHVCNLHFVLKQLNQCNKRVTKCWKWYEVYICYQGASFLRIGRVSTPFSSCISGENYNRWSQVSVVSLVCVPLLNQCSKALLCKVLAKALGSIW